MTWQPIKTAPRDGQFFIGANAEEAIICNWPKQARTDYAPGKWRRGRGEWNGSFMPTKSPLTHWQPLPKLPAAADQITTTSSGKDLSHD
jgi:hypothetical protein